MHLDPAISNFALILYPIALGQRLHLFRTRSAKKFKIRGISEFGNPSTLIWCCPRFLTLSPNTDSITILLLVSRSLPLLSQKFYMMQTSTSSTRARFLECLRKHYESWSGRRFVLLRIRQCPMKTVNILSLGLLRPTHALNLLKFQFPRRS